MFVFVILHYLAEEMTIECIEKINQVCKGNDYHIVIVDNASVNKSGERIYFKYQENDKCTVLLNEANLGFARGNNVGYVYAKKRFNPEYIVIMNNDVLIDDSNFMKKIEDIYRDTLFDVMGPDIHSCANGMHQNPIKMNGYKKDEVSVLIKKRKIRSRFFGLCYARKYMLDLMRRFKYKDKSKENLFIQQRVINPVLHGACFIFGKRFIKNEAVAFNENTFMYMEEDILHYYCMKKGYTMVYDPCVSVNHMEDIATNIEYRNAYKKAKMKEKYLLESAEVLYELMNEV